MHDQLHPELLSRVAAVEDEEAELPAAVAVAEKAEERGGQASAQEERQLKQLLGHLQRQLQLLLEQKWMTERVVAPSEVGELQLAAVVASAVATGAGESEAEAADVEAASGGQAGLHAPALE
jgi:hypothetical protein